MRYTVTQDTPAVLGAYGPEEVLQCIALILRTRQGDCPGYRGFGLPKEYLGVSQQAAIRIFRNELREALQDFNVAARIVSVTAEPTPDGEFAPVVEVEIDD